MPVNFSGVPYWYTKPDLQAECYTCGKCWYHAGAKGTASQHAKTHGHVVRVQEVRIFVYGETSPSALPSDPVT